MTDSQPNPQPSAPDSPMSISEFVDGNTLYPTDQFVARFLRELPAPEPSAPPPDLPVPIINLTPHLPPLRTVGPVWDVLEECLIEFAESAMLEIAPAVWETRSEHERWFYTPAPVVVRHYPDWGFLVGNFDPDLKEWCPPVYLSRTIIQTVRAILFAVVARRIAVDEESLRQSIKVNNQYIEEYLASTGEADPLNPNPTDLAPQTTPGKGEHNHPGGGAT